MRELVLVSIALISIADAEPRRLTLDDAVALADKHGYDNLLADADRVSAEGDLLAARALPNPQLGIAGAHAFNYIPHSTPQFGPCHGCAAYGFQVTLDDQKAIEGTLSGKRSLRRRIAELALRSSILARADARRKLELLVKQQYVTAVAADAHVQFASEVAVYASQILTLTRARFPATIDEGQLARIELDKLQADVDLRNAQAAAVQAESELRFVIGVELPPITLDLGMLAFRIPTPLENASETSMVALALTHRPDLAANRAEVDRATHALALARRMRFPDVTLSLNYYQLGTGQDAIQPPQLTLSASFALPVFYQQQGEIRRGQADVQKQRVERDKTTAGLVTDVQTALAAFYASRDVVVVIESRQLDAARRARDVTRAQWEAGTALLTDYLDAERAYVAVHRSHIDALATYWSSVFQLEEAVGGSF